MKEWPHKHLILFGGAMLLTLLLAESLYRWLGGTSPGWVMFCSFTLAMLMGWYADWREKRYCRRLEEDGLTGLGNAQWFYLRLHEEHARAQRLGLPIAVITLDLEIVDPPMIDHVMQSIGAYLRALMRKEEPLARLSDQRLAMLLFNCDDEQAQLAGSRLREQVLAMRVLAPHGGVVEFSLHLRIIAPRDTGGDINEYLTRTRNHQRRL